MTTEKRLTKKVRDWKYRAKGLCIICGKKSVNRNHCEKHRKSTNAQCQKHKAKVREKYRQIELENQRLKQVLEDINTLTHRKEGENV